MSDKPPILNGHDPKKSIGRLTATGIEFNDGWTPENFKAAAFAIAGPHWKTQLGPMIGKCRSQVWEYANGVRPVPKAVVKLMGLLAIQLAD